jgi:hypothetical protein
VPFCSAGLELECVVGVQKLISERLEEWDCVGMMMWIVPRKMEQRQNNALIIYWMHCHQSRAIVLSPRQRILCSTCDPLMRWWKGGEKTIVRNKESFDD